MRDSENWHRLLSRSDGPTEVQPPQRESSFQRFCEDARWQFTPQREWADRSSLEKAYVWGVAALVVAMLPLPYHFYPIIRLVVCGALAIFFLSTMRSEMVGDGTKVVLLGMMILYNPVFPISLGDKVVWTIINILTIWWLYRTRLSVEVPDGGVDGDDED